MIANSIDTVAPAEASNESPAWNGFVSEALTLMQTLPKLTERAGKLDRTELVDFGLIKKGETVKESIKIDGLDCEYHVRVPKSYDPNKPTPIIFAFHGYGAENGQGDVPPGAKGMELATGLSDRAEKDGFIVVYLNGNPDEKNAWNNKQWFFSKRDDIKFTSTLMDNMQRDLNVDPDRIYMVGFSNGASFVHNAVNKLAGRVAAIADVSGWMTGQETAAAKGVSVLAIHSKDDPAVKFDGRPIWQGVEMKPSPYTLEHYRQINDLNSRNSVHMKTALDGTTVTTHEWQNGTNGTEVKAIFLEKEGHLWFGGKANEKASVNATDEVLKFFEKHPKGK